MRKTAKNFAIWVAMNSGPSFFSLSPDFYSGRKQNSSQMFQEDEFCKHHALGERQMFRLLKIKQKIDEIGIDYEKSSTPKSDSVAMFGGTDRDSSWQEIVNGAICLNDGTLIEYYAECSLNMNQFEMMKHFFEEAE